MKKIFLICLAINAVSLNLFAQKHEVNKIVVWSTWTLLQTIPSPVFYQDKNDAESRLQFGVRWNISPLNYSFNANPLISPLSFFKVNPVRRYGGSVEIFNQPEWLTDDNEFSNLKRFSFSNGIRFFIPAVESGEYLSFSLGAKYKIRKDNNGIGANCFAAEAGVYSFFGILGLQFNYNFENTSRYDIGLWLKYY